MTPTKLARLWVCQVTSFTNVGATKYISSTLIEYSELVVSSISNSTVDVFQMRRVVKRNIQPLKFALPSKPVHHSMLGRVDGRNRTMIYCECYSHENTRSDVSCDLQ
jgi:hypothetical protein